jgi:uncharacterized membrane protein
MDKKILTISTVVVIAVLFLAGCTSTSQKGTNTNQNTQTNTPTNYNTTEARILVSDLSTTAKFFSYDSGGTTIRYFAVKDQQGNVHVAMDACDVCYEAKKGYKQDGTAMQCLNCGRTFAITSIGSANTEGGCWPSYLPMNNDGNTVVIKIADLEAKKYMF